MSKNTDMNETNPKEVFGPYEFWNFGKGRKYAFRRIKRQFKFLTAMATLNHPIKMGRILDEEPTESNAWFPTLWKERECLVSFLPYVDERDDRDNRLIVIADRLKNGIAGLLPFSFTALLDNIRVAFPVSRKSMDHSIIKIPNDPSVCELPDPSKCSVDDWNPDKKIQKWCSDQQNKKKRKHLTIIAVIDDGIPFAHRNFRAADGNRSRVEFCWLQSVARDKVSGRKSVAFGREYFRRDIENLISKYGSDEDYLYYASGALNEDSDFGSVLELRETHGAHVMDQACGYSSDREEEIREEIRVIAVQLPNDLTVDTSGFAKDPYILAAFHYIFNRADVIAKGYKEENLRLVINLSFGFSAGSLDGKSDLERSIDELIAHRRSIGKPTALVMPAGNSFLSRLHGEIWESDFSNHGDEFEFHWMLQPNDRTSSYLEIWFPKGYNPKNYSFHVCSPDGKTSRLLRITKSYYQSTDVNFLKVKKIWHENHTNGSTIGQISLDNQFVDNIRRWRITLILAPTEPDNESLQHCPSGRWKITVKRRPDSKKLGSKRLDVRIQRDESFANYYSGAKQSYLDDENYRVYDKFGQAGESDHQDNSYVKRFGTLNGLATGGTAVIVGGFTRPGDSGWNIEKGIPASFSSSGVINPPKNDRKVDCSALADRSSVLRGKTGIGTRSGSVSQIRGTSSASPYIACTIAEAFVDAKPSEVASTIDSNYRDLLIGRTTPKRLLSRKVGDVHPGSDQKSIENRTRLGRFIFFDKSEISSP